MPLFGSQRDINLIKSINKEIIQKILGQSILFYRKDISSTQTNIYGEVKKGSVSYYPPVTINVLLKHDPQQVTNTIAGPNYEQKISLYFLKEILKDINIFPQIGDIIYWKGNYWEISSTIENDFLFGFNNDYNDQNDSFQYSQDPNNNYGGSLSILCECSWVSEKKLGLKTNI